MGIEWGKKPTPAGLSGKTQGMLLTKNVYEDHLSDAPVVKGLGPKKVGAPAQAHTVITTKTEGKNATPPVVVKEEEEEDVVLEVGEPNLDYIPPHKLMHVAVRGGRKVNLGNYESAELSVSITWPCALGEQDVIYEAATEWVDKKLQAATADVEDLKKKGGA